MALRRPSARLRTAVAAAALGLLATGPAAAAPLPGPTPSREDPVRVEVQQLLPRAPTSLDETLVVTGDLVNAADTAVEDLEVRVLVAGVLDTRSRLARADASPPAGRARGPAVEPTRTRLTPGSSTPFALRVPVRSLGLSRLGVHPLQVEVRGRAVGTRRTVALGTASTFLPWFPDGPPAASRIAFLWPLVDEPARTPDGALLGEDLADDVAGGRLAALLDAARDGAGGACDEPVPPAEGAPAPVPGCRADPVPLTVAVDPELLEAVAALAQRHDVVDPGADGGRRSAAADEDAARWLQDLRELVAGADPEGDRPALPGADVLALPYADPDVVALSRSRTDLSDDVEQLRTLGRRAAAEALGVDPLETVAWPPSGRLTSAGLEGALGGGATAVVLDETALPPRRSDAGRTPGARTDLSSASAGPVTGLVVDDGLSRLLAVTPEDPTWQGERLAEQRWLAETAILAAERPGESRTFLVAPPRRAAVVAGVGAAVLRDAGRLPWLCPVALADVVEGTERCPGGVVDPAGPPVSEDRGALVATTTGEDSPGLSDAYLRQVAEVEARGAQLTDEVLVPGSDETAEVTARFLRARGRAESSAWRERPEQGRRVLRLADDDVGQLRAAVRLQTPGRQLLTSDTGVIDVTITNALDQPVTVGVQLNDPVEARLTSSDTAVRTIGPQQVVPVRLRAEARTSGQFVVRATLLDRSGRPFGEPAELVVRSTGYGRLALGITGVGAGILLAAAGVRIARRALRRSHALSDDDLSDDDLAG